VAAENILGKEEEVSTSSLVQVTPLVEAVTTSSPDQVTALKWRVIGWRRWRVYLSLRHHRNQDKAHQEEARRAISFFKF